MRRTALFLALLTLALALLPGCTREEEPVDAKPVIYLYPEQETKVNVQLTFNGTLTSTYPTLPPEGWTVTAQPDGTLTDQDCDHAVAKALKKLEEIGVALRQ